MGPATVNLKLGGMKPHKEVLSHVCRRAGRHRLAVFYQSDENPGLEAFLVTDG